MHNITIEQVYLGKLQDGSRCYLKKHNKEEGKLVFGWIEVKSKTYSQFFGIDYLFPSTYKNIGTVSYNKITDILVETKYPLPLLEKVEKLFNKCWKFYSNMQNDYDKLDYINRQPKHHISIAPYIKVNTLPLRENIKTYQKNIETNLNEIWDILTSYKVNIIK